jgi:hypothetical protein
MSGITRVGFWILLGLAFITGCSRRTSSNGAATTSDAGETVAKVDQATNPIARAAADFLDAVLKGDTQRGLARLSPKARQNIVATGKQFDPPGLDNPSFRVIDVRSPTEDHAFAQCELLFTAEGKKMREEMCCELRKVENDWRVSGIAYEPAPGKPWTLSDFETGQDIPITRQSESGTNSNTAAGENAGGRPSPPRTAQEAPTTSPAPLRR